MASLMHASAWLRRHRAAAGDAGFTVLEVMVSFTLFIIAVSGASVGIVNALHAAHISQQRIDAGNVAQTFVAKAQADAATISPETAVTYPASVSGEEFTVQRWVTFANVGATHCSAGSTFTVNVMVFQKPTGKFLARADSVISC